MMRKVLSKIEKPTNFRLRQLQPEEVMSIELFAIANCATECGLLGVEVPRPEMIEEEYVQFKKHLDKSSDSES